MVFGIDGQGILQETQRQVILHHTMKHQTNIALHQRERITVRGGLCSTSLNLRNSISSHQPFGGYISTLGLIFCKTKDEYRFCIQGLHRAEPFQDGPPHTPRAWGSERGTTASGQWTAGHWRSSTELNASVENKQNIYRSQRLVWGSFIFICSRIIVHFLSRQHL